MTEKVVTYRRCLKSSGIPPCNLSACKAVQSVATVTRDEVPGEVRCNENLPGRQYKNSLQYNVFNRKNRDSLFLENI